MPLQEDLQPDEDLVEGGLAKCKSLFQPIAHKIALIRGYQIIAYTIRQNQNLFSGPAARYKDELSLETVLPTRLQPRKAEGSPAAEAANLKMNGEVEVVPQQPRKRGRPKGWKPGTPYSTHNSGGPTPANRPIRKPKSSSKAPSQEPRRRGRPPKPPDLTIREWYLRSDPKYMPFGCEWHEENLKGQLTQCPAELQNMDTLRKHVLFIHCNTGPLVCRWGKCGHKLAETVSGEEVTTDEAGHHQPEEFVNEDALRAHVEKEHLEPYDPNKLPRYLFDQDGNQVTPSIKDQQFEDAQGTLERKRRLRAIQRQAIENAPDESEFFLQPLDADM
ncbi:transcription factor Zn- C2H2 [Apiospora phragmitis]|uniref:Transcription factor Zn- C2H2 n=1 Tax=Apiospora phragmitis TaxID=2905665 RepID=A0ABR1WV50_9PEZI